VRGPPDAPVGGEFSDGAVTRCLLSVCRLQGRGELRGGPAHRRHHGAGHAEQPPLQVLQDQHDPQAALHHRRAARYADDAALRRAERLEARWRVIHDAPCSFRRLGREGGDRSGHQSEGQHQVLDSPETHLHRLGPPLCLRPRGGEEPQ